MFYFTCQVQTKIPFVAVLIWFLILDKIQNGDHCGWRHRPPAAPPESKYWKKIFSVPIELRRPKAYWNTATYQKL